MIAGKRPPDLSIGARSEDQRERGRPVPEIDSDCLSGCVEVARAIEDVVRDQKGDPELEPEGPEIPPVAAEQARGLEELPGLQRAAGEVVLHGGIGLEGLAAL